jgi:protein gp37
MSDRSSIEWTEATWNPVTGCTEVSPGCDNCYARTFAERWRGIEGHPYEQGFEVRFWPERLNQPARWKRSRRIFVNSMSDLFQESVPKSFIGQVLDAMDDAPQHAFQVLTKRPGRMSSVLRQLRPDPSQHVWYGTSVELDDYTWRVDKLRETPAAVRFLSLEPLLGPLPSLDLTDIDWVIVGGESGHEARPMKAAWVQSIIELARDSGTAFFFKQLGSVWASELGVRGKGTELDEIPGEFHLRQYPAATNERLAVKAT